MSKNLTICAPLVRVFSVHTSVYNFYFRCHLYTAAAANSHQTRNNSDEVGWLTTEEVEQGTFVKFHIYDRIKKKNEYHILVTAVLLYSYTRRPDYATITSG